MRLKLQIRKENDVLAPFLTKTLCIDNSAQSNHNFHENYKHSVHIKFMMIYEIEVKFCRNQTQSFDASCDLISMKGL